MHQPLKGLKVIDFTHVVAGPLCTHFLRLLGAEVIKVESPAGDPLRNYSLVPEERGMAPAFIGINAGKKSVVLDLKSEEGRAAARHLIATSDILVENFRPGVMARLGFGFEEARAIRPGLIYCSVSGFGLDSPLRDHPAIDQIVQSLSGLMLVSGKESDGPMRIGIPIVDTFSGLLAAFSVVSAVVQRERFGGEGQFVDVAMLDATMVMMLSVVNPFLINGTKHVRTGNLGFSRAPTADTFPTRKGDITVGAVQQVQVERLCRALGCSELLEDQRFATGDNRIANAEAFQAELRSAFAKRSAAEWVKILAETGVPAGEVCSVEDVLERGWVDGRDLRMRVAMPEGNTVEILNAGFRFAEGGPRLEDGPPPLGAHTEEILAEVMRSPRPDSNQVQD